MNILARRIHEAAEPLTGSPRDYDPLLETCWRCALRPPGRSDPRHARFYRERAQITRRLIRERGFRAVPFEADWPDACRVNRFVRSAGVDTDAGDALGGFRWFPHSTGL